MKIQSLRRALASAALAPLLALSALAYAGGTPIVDSMGPVEVGNVDIENFGVVDGRIFRGAQPEEDDYRKLAALGVTTIVDLRGDAEDYARVEAERAGLEYVNIKLKSTGRPNDAAVRTFLDTLDRTFARGADSKAYVHCAGGRHRTGSMIGVYRLVRNGWTADRAYAEMKAYDYYKGLFLFVGHKNYVFDYYKRMQRNPSSVPAAYAAPSPQSVVHTSGN
jgi:protein-tyrosine phosphatase